MMAAVCCFFFCPSKNLALSQSLLPCDIASAQFIDLGCGKGKAVFMYALLYGISCHFPVTGIEYDPSLSLIASRNVSRLISSNISISISHDTAINVANYITSEYAIVLIYNSFQGNTFIEVLNKQVSSTCLFMLTLLKHPNS